LTKLRVLSWKIMGAAIAVAARRLRQPKGNKKEKK
jgi:hypothetical protein